MLKRYTAPHVERLRIFSEKYKVYVAPVILIFGFVLDFLTLRRVDGVFDNIILISHLLIAGLAIMLLFSKDASLGRRLGVARHWQKIEYVMLFSFGALFSGSIIFYSKSASLGSSWPFLLVLLILMIGTEFQKKYFQRLIFQINFYFIALFSYLIVLVPVVAKDMGPDLFFMSGILALLLISLFFGALSLIDKEKLLLYLRKLSISVMSVFFLFNFLYFSNIIPPIPLSLKFTGVYHTVYRTSPTSYVGVYEKAPAWQIWKKQSHTIHRAPGGSVYVFSSVFAPTRLSTSIYHQWQFRDPIDGGWVDSSRIEIGISGGREDGFRGYSMKRSLQNGTWRVIIETSRGQKLGQIRFKIAPEGEGIIMAEEVL